MVIHTSVAKVNNIETLMANGQSLNIGNTE